MSDSEEDIKKIRRATAVQIALELIKADASTCR